MKKRLTLVVCLLLLALPLAAETQPATEQQDLIPKGIVELEKDYMIFPEGKIGNSLYHKKKRIFSRQDLVIRDIFDAKEGLIYLAYNVTEEPNMGWIGPEGVTLEAIEDGFYLFERESKRKIFRVDPKGKIQNLLPRSNTPDNLVSNGKNKAVFSHITAGEAVEVEGRSRYLYTFKIHIVRKNAERIETLPTKYHSYDSKLKYTWVQPNLLKIRHGDGEVAEINVK